MRVLDFLGYTSAKNGHWYEYDDKRLVNIKLGEENGKK